MKWWECKDLNVIKGECYCRRLDNYLCFKHNCKWIEICENCVYYDEDSFKYESDLRRLCRYWMRFGNNKSLRWRFRWDSCNNYKRKN